MDKNSLVVESPEYTSIHVALWEVVLVFFFLEEKNNDKNKGGNSLTIKTYCRSLRAEI